MTALKSKLLSVFLISVVLIAYELAVMRSFAVGSWSTFGSLVISIALLGFGLAGTVLTFWKRAKAQAFKWLSFFALLLPVTMALGHILAQQIPFNPKFITRDSVQLWLIGAYFLVYSLPFLCGAFYLGFAFMALADQVHRLYFWNMAGSGLGGFLILLAMYFIKTDYLSLPLFVLSTLGALLCLLYYDEAAQRLRIRLGSLIAAGISLALSCLLLIFFGSIRVSEEKSISVFKKFPQYCEIYTALSPLGEYELFESSYLHSAPGISENFSANKELVASMPLNAFLGLYVDGSGPIQFIRDLKKEESFFIDYLPMAAPYKLLKQPSVFVVRAGGGLSTFMALAYKASAITVVEPNPMILHLLKEVKVVTDFNGNLMSRPPLTVKQEEPRALAALSPPSFDLVEISLIDSIGLNDDGGYSVVENYTYTVEAFRDFMKPLKKGGILSLTVWNKLSPPRNVLRLITTVYNSLVAQGVTDPTRRIYMFDDLLKTATILVKHQADFTDEEIASLDEFCKDCSFEVCYKPGITLRHTNWERVLELNYRAIFAEDAQISDSLAPAVIDDTTNLLNLLAEAKAEHKDEEEIYPGDLYQLAWMWLLEGREQDLYSRYVFDIRPATDDRPYYTAYLKPETAPAFLAQIQKVASEWGYILLLASLLQSLIFGVVIILLPLIGRWQELFKRKGGTLGVIAYFACLGLGYMFVEIFLMQKLSYFLADPIYATSIVISAMLIISGLGSLLSARIASNRTLRIKIAAGGIALSLLFYIFLLSPILNLCLGLPFIIKVVLAVILIAPAAFFMGMPFPTGLDALAEKRPGLLPWAWGMNGALSVTGSSLARLLSVSFGFTPVLVAAILIYVAVGLIYRVNEKTA